jgi:hypothetical protein
LLLEASETQRKLSFAERSSEQCKRHALVSLVVALCYKSEGRCFDPHRGRWIFTICASNPSSRNMGLGFTQPLIEMSIANLPECKGRPAR